MLVGIQFQHVAGQFQLIVIQVFLETTNGSRSIASGNALHARSNSAVMKFHCMNCA